MLGDMFVVPLRKGWWGAARLIDVSEGYTFFILDGFWHTSPSVQDLDGSNPMKASVYPGHSHLPEEWKGWFDGKWPAEFEIITNSPLTKYERAQGLTSIGCMVFQSARGFANALFSKWRQTHDREAFEAECKREAERCASSNRARAQARRKELSLAKMARERPFGHWADMWGKSVVAEARRIFREGTRNLIALEGSSPSKQRAAVLRGIVDAFNSLNERSECIETSEREEIVERIEELAVLVRLRNTNERLTGHRDW
ncbi:MAG: hypothetical protein JRH20_04380 [Deltaproteobacteria bacterium]|nr:hypothetical protein [Deltaproteobacteria bacterium]